MSGYSDFSPYQPSPDEDRTARLQKEKHKQKQKNGKGKGKQSTPQNQSQYSSYQAGDDLPPEAYQQSSLLEEGLFSDAPSIGAAKGSQGGVRVNKYQTKVPIRVDIEAALTYVLGPITAEHRFSLCCFQREAGGGTMRDPSFQTYLSHRPFAIADPLGKMTDLFNVKPVVRLPQRQGSNSFREDGDEDQRSRDNEVGPAEQMKPSQYQTCSMATDNKLYIKGLSRSINRQQVLETLKCCSPKSMVCHSVHLGQTDRSSDGFIIFTKNEDAEKALALYNGVTFDDGSRLHLYFTEGDEEPEPSANVLQVHNLPTDTTSQDIYSLFRVYGPLSFCTIVTDEPNVEIRESALVQFFEQIDADAAQLEMDEKEYHGKILSVQPMASDNLPVPESNLGASKDSNVMATGYLYNPVLHQQIPSSATAPDTFVESQVANIDYSNLYIKNLDLNIKSSDLFNLFRKFGRIISARVMNNAQTGISKGFGFVSFSKPEEAYIALQDMNGKLILSKHIIVAYHEPKKPRSDKPASTVPSTMRGIPSNVQHKMNQYPNAIPTPNIYDPGMSYTNTDMARAYMPPYAPPPPPPPGVISAAPIVYRQEEQLPMQYPNQSMQMMMGYHPANASYPPVYPYNEDYVSGSVNRIVKKYSNNALRQQHSNEGSVDTVSPHSSGAALPPSSTAPVTNTITTNTEGPSLSSLASGATIQPAPTIIVPKQKTLRRNSIESLSSVMTESSSSIQKLRLIEAVKRSGETEHIDDIVDMLLTLKRKERSLCLFNPDFLRSKINLAKEALELFDEDSDSVKESDEIISPLPTGLSKNSSMDNSQFEKYLTTEQSRVLQSKYSSSSPKSTATASHPTPSRASDTEIDNFLASLQGLSLFEKKQKLGDRLFPLVKATGTKQAPKMTIRLLDTIELYELAHLMHDKSELKEKVDEVYVQMQS
ncbi:hypothetical protein NQZ79_g8049 [Umbelopsis isabellina]|nr:hypothetical protein NQZ79_g8049 [Umbelopsis isabellina]